MNHCVICDKEIPRPPGRGAPRKTCSDGCRLIHKEAQRVAARAHVPECSVDDCVNGARSSKHPLCEMHYGRMRRYGATEPGVCAYCGSGKPHERSIYCSRVCSLRMHRARRYGLTADEALAYEATRDGHCDICSRVVDDPKGLHWDHDHQTGELRGLLCSPCNTGLGMFGDDVERLRAAIEYLDLGL